MGTFTRTSSSTQRHSRAAPPQPRPSVPSVRRRRAARRRRRRPRPPRASLAARSLTVSRRRVGQGPAASVVGGARHSGEDGARVSISSTVVGFHPRVSRASVMSGQRAAPPPDSALAPVLTVPEPTVATTSAARFPIPVPSPAPKVDRPGGIRLHHGDQPGHEIVDVAEAADRVRPVHHEFLPGQGLHHERRDHAPVRGQHSGPAPGRRRCRRAPPERGRRRPGAARAARPGRRRVHDVVGRLSGCGFGAVGLGGGLPTTPAGASPVRRAA